MLNKFFSGKINSIMLAAFLVALSSFVSRLLGIFRDRILASEFGAGETLDIYYAAFRIPDLVFNLLVLGALSAGFIPVFTALLKNPLENLKDKVGLSAYAEAWDVASNVINVLGLFLLLIAGLGIIFAPELTGLLTPGFSFEAQRLTADITRIMFLPPLFLGISSIIGGILQSFKSFFVYSLSPIFYNIGIIAGAIWLVPLWGIYGLAYGVIIGSFLHLAIQLPAVFNLGFRYRLIFDLRNKYLRKIGKMMVPRTLSLAINQFNLIIITGIASTLAVGSLTVFNLANNLQSFPIGVFGISFAIAAFPTLSAVAADKQKLIDSFSDTFRQILFFIVPSTILLLTLRAQIIRVVLGTGSFGWRDTILTMNTLGFFSLSLFAQSSIPLLTRMFYARHNSSVPFYIGLLSVAVNVILSYYFSQSLGVVGLALAFSFSSILNFIILWLVLRIQLGDLDEYRILLSALKFSLAAVFSGFSVQIVKQVVWPFVDMSRTWGVFFQGIFAGLTGIAVYVIFCLIFKSEELLIFWSAFKRRLPGKRLSTDDKSEARGI
jgi:putative peptidoglycan lipid II flippase